MNNSNVIGCDNNPIGWRATPVPEPPDSMNPKDKLGLKKPALRLVPWVAVLWMAKVFTFGAKKYSEFNWRKKKVRSSVYDEAALRHIIAVMDGQDLDEETGLPHEAHVMACMAIKLDARACGVLVDDRDPTGNVAALINFLTEKDESRKEPVYKAKGGSFGSWDMSMEDEIKAKKAVDTSKDDAPF